MFHFLPKDKYPLRAGF